MHRLTSLLIVACVGTAAQAAPGDLDPSFAGRGFVELSIPGSDVYVKSVVADPDGGIVALANAQALPQGGIIARASIVVARWRADGSPDPTFGIGGMVIVDVPNHTYAFGATLLRMPDARYLLGGTATAGGTTGSAILARILRTGQLDPSFGSGGIVMHDFDPTTIDGIVTLVDDGAGGAALVHRTGAKTMMFTRFTAAGVIDASFGTDGLTTVTPAPHFNVGRDLVMLPHGGLLGVGWAEPAPGVRTVGFVRLLANGTTDASFGPDGTRLLFPGNTVDALTAVPGGAIVVGTAFAGKILDDGNPDPTFVFSGLSGRFPILRAVAFSAGQLYAGGETLAPDGAALPLLVRMQANGSIDPSFGIQGNARLERVGIARIYAVKLDLNGKAIVAGELYPPSERRAFVARIETRPPDVADVPVPLGGIGVWLMLTLSLAACAAPAMVNRPRSGLRSARTAARAPRARNR